MKNFLIILLFILLPIISLSQNYGKEYIHQDLGVWSNEINDNIFIEFHAYVTKSYNHDTLNNDKYRYNIIVISKSKYNNAITNTWLYGTRIYLNGEEKTKDQFPNGFIFSIGIEPTILYQIYSNRDNNHFEIKWNKSIIEPRTNR